MGTTWGTNKRISKVKTRLNGIGSRLESTESMFLQNAPSYFYDNPFTGKEWQRKDPLRGLIFRRDRASKYVNRRRNEALPLPDLSDLDRISMDGPCVKKYSDSNFFMNEWLEAEKKKMEEEKAKRREKMKKKAEDIKVTQYRLIDLNKGGDLDFASSDGNVKTDRTQGITTKRSVVSGLAQKRKQEKASKKKVNSPQKGPPAFNPSPQQQSQQQPGGGGAVPLPVPNMGGGNAVPPPVPGGGGGGPPPIPGSNMGMAAQPKQKLTAQQMAERSRAAMEEKMQHEAPSSQPAQAGPPKMNALMMSIRGGANLKKATVVKREPGMEKRDMMLMALKKKGQTGLKKVAESDKNVKKVEEKDATIFAILNRRQFMADDSESESGSSWSSED